MRTEGMTVRAVFDFIRKACSKVKFQVQRCFKGAFISSAKRRLQSKAIQKKRKDLGATNVNELESLKYGHSQHFHAIILTRTQAVLESRSPLEPKV